MVQKTGVRYLQNGSIGMFDRAFCLKAGVTALSRPLNMRNYKSVMVFVHGILFISLSRIYYCEFFITNDYTNE